MSRSTWRRWPAIGSRDGYTSPPNAERNSGGLGRNKHVRDRKDVHAGYSDSANKPKDFKRRVLNHVGQTLGKNRSQASIDFYRWSDSRGRPNMALALSYYLEKRGDFVRADYYFNPVAAGFRDTGGAGWRGSPWHADIASKDERKLADCGGESHRRGVVWQAGGYHQVLTGCALDIGGRR